MRKCNDLTLDDKLPFGKHKGKNIGQVIIDDPDYLLWLRTQRINDVDSWSGCSYGFDEEVNILLDEICERNGGSKGFGKYLPRPHLKVKVQEEALEENCSTNVVEKQIEGWGAF